MCRMWMVGSRVLCFEIELDQCMLYGDVVENDELNVSM